MKLNVPYYSQFLDVDDKFWMLRACGATCLKMVAEYHLSVQASGANVPDIISLCNEAKEKGGYDMTNGWVHNYLVSKAEEFGLKAHPSEGLTNIIDEIISSINAGNPVIVSVEKRVLEQTRFHLIVIVGYERSDNQQSSPYDIQASNCFYYHEPESTDKTRGQYRVCDTETFINYWRGKAIFISKNTSTT